MISTNATKASFCSPVTSLLDSNDTMIWKSSLKILGNHVTHVSLVNEVGNASTADLSCETLLREILNELYSCSIYQSK